MHSSQNQSFKYQIGLIIIRLFCCCYLHCYLKKTKIKINQTNFEIHFIFICHFPKNQLISGFLFPYFYDLIFDF